MDIFPIGYVKKENGTLVELLPEFIEGLDGLKEGNFVKLLLWFHLSDTPEKRRILKVHPRGDPKNPLRGVFSTRSPVRPNPIAVYTVRILEITDGKLKVEDIDALDGTPVLDIKPFVERLDCPQTSLSLFR
ncbi:tRNA (N6-threonylcarbamoyladenosine(37)-N6)-methyltransferase TrmO [Thermococcus sp.]|uniref:tRNA (N6-threonylcarbamoyladenosine(37)-N6)-methyltransferase TrmO n=1 Tax=Thermococcus sp. TaxID=35749 RepID=UPI00260C3CA8|nr:tRNA (N6-threonylcarbamoyladenosine(37)-N6)-methyltransferase TrmO [Thermococcus sp.]